MAAFYAMAVVWGIRSIHYWEPSSLDLLVPIALAVALGWWAVADARSRGRPLPLFARPWFVLLAGLLVPGYVIWSRKGWGLALVLLHAVAWYGLAAIVMHVGGSIVFGAEWWRTTGTR